MQTAFKPATERHWREYVWKSCKMFPDLHSPKQIRATDLRTMFRDPALFRLCVGKIVFCSGLIGNHQTSGEFKYTSSGDRWDLKSYKMQGSPGQWKKPRQLTSTWLSTSRGRWNNVNPFSERRTMLETYKGRILNYRALWGLEMLAWAIFCLGGNGI